MSSSSTPLELSKVVTKCSTVDMNDETHNANIKPYADLASKHAQILDEWNKKTLILKDIVTSIKDKHITEINDDDDDEKVALTFGGKLYKQYMRCNSYMDHQAKRLKQSTSGQYLMELIIKQNAVSEQVIVNKSKGQFSKSDYQQSHAQYESMKQQRTELGQVIQDTVVKYNALISEENELFQQMMQKKQMKQIVDTQTEDLTTSSVAFVSLIDGYNEFIKNTKQNIQQLTQYLNEEWDTFEATWWTWSAEDIVAWFKFKTRKLNTHRLQWEAITIELNKRNISGHSLSKFNYHRLPLDLIGIQDFDISKFLMRNIIDLRNKYKYQADEAGKVAADNADHSKSNQSIPQTFLCPITKQIMKEPVIAFDGRTYEKEAIEQYLKMHKKSPITNAVAYTLNTFPNMQLQDEIQSFRQLNKLMCMEEGNNDTFVQNKGTDTGHTAFIE
eukprot:412940_1